jgi:hypothetical protein
MDKACVVGAEDLKIQGLAGKHITIDGATGRVWIEKSVPVVQGAIPAFVEDMIAIAMTNDTSFLSVAPESVSKGSTVMADVSGRLGTQKALSEALRLLSDSQASGVISFGRNTVVNLVDREFLNFFGASQNVHDSGTLLVIEKVLKMGKWTKTFKKNWTLYLPSDTPVDYANVIRSHGWKVVTVVNSFKAALNIDGYIVLEESFKEQLTRENMTFGEIESLISKAGREVKELPVAVTKARRLFDVLGG